MRGDSAGPTINPSNTQLGSSSSSSPPPAALQSSSAAFSRHATTSAAQLPIGHSSGSSPGVGNSNNLTSLTATGEKDCDTDQETDRLLGAQRSSSADEKHHTSSQSSHHSHSAGHHHNSSNLSSSKKHKQNNNAASQQLQSPPLAAGATGASASANSSREVLIEGVLFRARYLGSTQLICEGQPTKATRMMQAEEAVSRIKVCVPL